MRAISWAAVSSKPQAQRESLNDQHRLNHALAEALEWELLADITVPGESRSYYRLSDATANVAAYTELTSLADSGALDWLICKSRDRLARTRRLNREVADYLQDHGIRIYSRAFPPGSIEKRTEAEVWSEAIESGYSEAEILRLKQRHEMGMQGRVRAGKLPGRLPWGFARVQRVGETTIAFVDPLAEASIRFVVGEYLKGIIKKLIIAQAERAHLSTPRGTPWSKGTLNYILEQPAYYGLVAYGRRRLLIRNGQRTRTTVPWADCILTEAEFDGVFTPDVWDALRAEQQRRIAEHPRSRGAAYPLSGIAYCMDHHRFFVGSPSGPRRYYRCYPPGAPCHSIREHVLHKRLGTYFARLATDEELFEEILASLEAPQHEDWSGQEERLLTERDDALRRQERIWQAYEGGVITLADYAKRQREMEATEQQIEARLEAIARSRLQVRQSEDLRETLRDGLAELPAALAGELEPEQRQAIRAALSRVFGRLLIKEGKIVSVRLAVP